MMMVIVSYLALKKCLNEHVRIPPPHQLASGLGCHGLTSRFLAAWSVPCGHS